MLLLIQGLFLPNISLNVQDMRIQLYDWQKTTIFIVGFLTAVNVFYNDYIQNRGREFDGYRWDLVLDSTTAVGLNVLILWIIFKLGNWIYYRLKIRN